MIRPEVTFSYGPLLENCQHFAIAGAVWTAIASEFAEGGTIVHNALDALVADGVLEHLEDETHRALYAAGRAWLYRRGFLRAQRGTAPGVRSEIAFAYDHETGVGRELVTPPGWERRWYADRARRAAYDGPGGPVRESEMPGRLDLLRFSIDGGGDREQVLEVYDYKCHFGPGYQTAKAQLELCGLAAARAYNVDRVRVVGVHLWADREPLEEPYELGPFELAEIAATVRGWASAANDPPPVPGAHCGDRYCPARPGCPVTQRLVGELLPADRLVRRAENAPALPAAGPVALGEVLASSPASPASPASAAALPEPAPAFSFLAPIASSADADMTLVAIDLLKELVKQKQAQVNAWADKNGGIPRKDGRIYAGAMEPRESINLAAPGAQEKLEELGLGLAIKQAVSWGDIEKLQGKPGAKRAREALRAIGALTNAPRKVYDDRAPEAAPAPQLPAAQKGAA
ncbi:MAG TPA: PD-(D/E)XK nuclease family protein [Polyangiaceae bacterium]